MVRKLKTLKRSVRDGNAGYLLGGRTEKKQIENKVTMSKKQKHGCQVWLNIFNQNEKAKFEPCSSHARAAVIKQNISCQKI